MTNNLFDAFIREVSEAIQNNNFVKIIASKPDKRENTSISKVAGRRVSLKAGEKLSLTFKYDSKEEVKNFDFDEGKEQLGELRSAFQIFTLLTTNERIELRRSKKGKETIHRFNENHLDAPSLDHNRSKKRMIDSNAKFLQAVGITDSSGNVIPRMAGKWKQINKFLEIIESLIDGKSFQDPIKIVDMGSGSGYLTFGLYHYLTSVRKFQVQIVGIDKNEELIEKCNKISAKLDFNDLQFVNSSISEFEQKQIDILIALHACDTATDDAISKGIYSNAQLIVCAPCCHKQLRKDTPVKEMSDPLMQFGIYRERQFEMITDTIRSIILEKAHYKAKIFEFVSNEHTRKNIMLVGTKDTQDAKDTKAAEQKWIEDTATQDKKLKEFKAKYSIGEHHLEKLLINHDWN